MASVPKKPWVPDHLRVVLVAEDNDDLAVDFVTIACPPKIVQFAKYIIVGSQMDLAEIKELPKKFLREEASRAFLLQASVSLILPFLFYSESYICLFIYYFAGIYGHVAMHEAGHYGCRVGQNDVRRLRLGMCSRIKPTLSRTRRLPNGM